MMHTVIPRKQAQETLPDGGSFAGSRARTSTSSQQSRGIMMKVMHDDKADKQVQRSLACGRDFACRAVS